MSICPLRLYDRLTLNPMRLRSSISHLQPPAKGEKMRARQNDFCERDNEEETRNSFLVFKDGWPSAYPEHAFPCRKMYFIVSIRNHKYCCIFLNVNIKLRAVIRKCQTAPGESSPGKDEAYLDEIVSLLPAPASPPEGGGGGAVCRSVVSPAST